LRLLYNVGAVGLLVFLVPGERVRGDKVGVVQLHLDQEGANVGLEDRMDGIFLAGEDLLHTDGTRSY